MACTDFRGVEARIAWFRLNKPSGPGMCAQHCWHALGGDKGCPPRWYKRNANEIYDAVRASGRFFTSDPPRGALILWKYGANGHAAISLGDGKIITTDPTGNLGGTGVEDISYPKKWGASATRRIWTDQYAGTRFTVAGDMPSGKVYLSKLRFGQRDSDSVKRLQSVLNDHKLAGGSTLPVTGNYLDMTDNEVRLCQQQHGFGNDPAGKSFIGPQQAEHLFAKSGHLVIDDTETTPEVPEYDFQPKTGTTLGAWLSEQGFDVDDVNVSIGRASEWRGVQFIMWHHTASAPDRRPVDEANFIRQGSDVAPLSQIMVDQSGKVWMCSYERDGQPDPGRASHAGSGRGYDVPDDAMNQVSLGIEFMCDGSKPISAYPKMYEVGLDLTAALCKRYDVMPEEVIGHKEWSDAGKVDPRDDMEVVRRSVAELLDPLEPEVPVEPPVDGDEVLLSMTATQADGTVATASWTAKIHTPMSG